MKIKNLENLETPCLILDKSLLEKNCLKVRKKCHELKTTLRPHVKTPKCIEVAKILKKSNKKTAIVKKFHKDYEDEIKLIESNLTLVNFFFVYLISLILNFALKKFIFF